MAIDDLKARSFVVFQGGDPWAACRVVPLVDAEEKVAELQDQNERLMAGRECAGCGSWVTMHEDQATWAELEQEKCKWVETATDNKRKIKSLETALAECERQNATLKADNAQLCELAGLKSQTCADLAKQFVDMKAYADHREKTLRRLLVEMAIPYEALLMDAPSRKWIAPEVWSAIETAITKIRAALAKAEENNV